VCALYYKIWYIVLLFFSYRNPAFLTIHGFIQYTICVLSSNTLSHPRAVWWPGNEANDRLHSL